MGKYINLLDVFTLRQLKGGIIKKKRHQIGFCVNYQTQNIHSEQNI